jgi:arylsulfatase
MKVLIPILIGLLPLQGMAESKKSTKPNIIVIMPDDSGYGNYSCFGNPIIKTPNIDALKKQSFLLTRYHSSARCSPSRAKLMSGRHEFLSGVTDTRFMRHRLSLDTITLPQALKTAGYATGFFGKWHLGGVGRSNDAIRLNVDEGPYRPENRGFEGLRQRDRIQAQAMAHKPGIRDPAQKFMATTHEFSTAGRTSCTAVIPC